MDFDGRGDASLPFRGDASNMIPLLRRTLERNGDMDSLAGELTTMDLGEVLTLIADKRLTGQLLLDEGDVSKSIFIQDGQVTQCSSNQLRDSFGQMLRQFDRIGDAELQMAQEAQVREQTLLGVQLVRLGLMGQEDVCQNLVAKMRETILDAVQWQGGTFRFLRGALPPDIPAIDVAVEVRSLLQEVEFRKTVWETMRQVFPSDRLTLIPHEERLPRGLQPGSLDSRIYDMIHAGATLGEIGDQLFRSPFFLYQKIYALYRQGAVEIGPERPPEQPMMVGESMEDATQMVNMARSFLQSGNYSQAELILDQILETNPLPDVMQFKAKVEEAHLQSLRQRILDPDPIPRLVRSVDGLSLSAQEKYLLRRIDGTRSVHVLLRISPMREFDALKCLEHFIDAGYVEMPIAIP